MHCAPLASAAECNYHINDGKTAVVVVRSDDRTHTQWVIVLLGTWIGRLADTCGMSGRRQIAPSTR